MDPQTLAPLYLLWDALAVLGVLSGLVLALAGYRVFERVAQLPGLILGVLIAGGLAYFLWHEPLATIAAAAVGGWVGAAIIRAHRNALIFASGAWVGLLVAVAMAALLAVLMQRMPTPAVLLLLFVAMPVVAGFLSDPKGRWLVSVGGGKLLIWDWGSGKCLRSLGNFSDYINKSELVAVPERGSLGSIAFSPYCFLIKVCDVGARKSVTKRTQDPRSNCVFDLTALHASQDGQWLAWGLDTAVWMAKRDKKRRGGRRPDRGLRDRPRAAVVRNPGQQ